MDMILHTIITIISVITQIIIYINAIGTNKMIALLIATSFFVSLWFVYQCVVVSL